MSVLVEACVDAIDAALEAERGGADRLELCGELLQGGVTPSAGLIGAVWERVEIPVFVLVRPRSGDFLYDADEVDVMVRDIAAARAMDVDGVVIGALTRDGDVDIGTVHALMEVAGRMKVTFHRAFDFARDREVALEALIEQHFAKFPAAQVFQRLDDAAIANAAMNTVEAFLEHPQLHARDRVREVGSPNGPLMSFLPAITIPGINPVMGDIPAVGEHTDAILAELGLREKAGT